jgi:aminoglycoside phosphotransferase family enzyme/predicted kinase
MTESIASDVLVEGLLKPAAYPWRPASVELIETHVSWLFFAGDRVVKVKRPVSFGFVDHRTVEQRRLSCDEEVRLNRRLTDGVYLGVTPIGLRAGKVTCGEEDGPVEWATLMRRLPASRMLDRLLAGGEAPDDLADRLARRLIPFHAQIAGRCGPGVTGDAAPLAAVLTDNLDELAQFGDSLLSHAELALIDEAVRDLLHEERPLLGQRAADWARDGHGDLRAEHVCLELDGRTQIFDCVEFSPAIRCADVASDLAFLTMDLRRLGASGTAEQLVARYRANGIDLPPRLMALYETHRALVRAKGACLTHVTAGHQRHPLVELEAERYLASALASGVTRSPALIAMTGVSGSGKSTVAATLARSLGLERISSDQIRDTLAGAEAGPAAYGKGAYREEWTRRTYRELLHHCRAVIATGRIALADAAFLAAWQREDAAELARELGVPLLWVETVATDEVAERRLLDRQSGGHSDSDAGVEIRRRQLAAATRSPVPFPVASAHVVVDTSGTGSIDLDPVVETLRAVGALTARIPG